jgi:hypothetical protein
MDAVVEVAVGADVKVDMGVESEVIVEVGVEVELERGMGAGLGTDCSVSEMAAETVEATISSICPVSIVGAEMGAVAVGSPGITQAAIIAKNSRAMKMIRLLFMVFSLIDEIKKPPGYYSREA